MLRPSRRYVHNTSVAVHVAPCTNSSSGNGDLACLALSRPSLGMEPLLSSETPTQRRSNSKWAAATSLPQTTLSKLVIANLAGSSQTPPTTLTSPQSSTTLLRLRGTSRQKLAPFWCTPLKMTATLTRHFSSPGVRDSYALSLRWPFLSQTSARGTSPFVRTCGFGSARGNVLDPTV